jgi:hypothetical protein
MVTRKIYAYSFQMSLWNVILTSRDAKIGKPILLISASREVNIMFQRLLWNDQN